MMIIGFIVGFLFGPFIGIIAVIITGFILFKIKNPNKSPVPSQDAMPDFVTSLFKVIGRIMVIMMLSLPIASAGLIMANFRNPDTLIKYVSVIIADPSNITFTTGLFPGMPLMMLGGIILIIMGILIPEKLLADKMKWLFQVLGMAIITVTPIISFFAFDSFMDFSWGYGIVFYLGWIGVVIQLIAPMIGKNINPSTPAPPPQYATYALLAVFATPILASISTSPSPEDTKAAAHFFEILHHGFASGIGALIAGLGGPPMAEELIEDKSTILELTYPAGRSPSVFTTGWVFGARAVINVGGENEQDVSHLVKWSGSGSFNPSVGNRSRPTLGMGGNNIILEIKVGETHVRKTFHVNAVTNRLHAAVGDNVFCPADSHGCPACPHPVNGLIATGSPNVLINGKPAARVGDGGTHAACCGPNSFTIVGSSSQVVIDGRRAVKMGDATQHCGGTGYINKGAP